MEITDLRPNPGSVKVILVIFIVGLLFSFFSIENIFRAPDLSMLSLCVKE